MAITESSRVVTLVLLCGLPALFAQERQFPNVSIRALKPNGIIVSATDIPNMNYFELQGNINTFIIFGDSGDISIVVPKSKNGFWTGRDDNVTLKVGDIIYYYIHVGIRGKQGLDKINFSYEVKELFTSESLDTQPTTTTTIAPPSECKPTLTQLNSRLFGAMQTICSNQIIFEDNFADSQLNTDNWTLEQYIPQSPEYPFVSYQRSMVSLKDGELRIEPKQQENMPGFDSSSILCGTLDLTKGCTRSGSCVYNSCGPQILQPIASGRVTSNIAFKYGIIEVRARVPQGDWLYPDILLEPFRKPYGTEDNRVLRIAGARGNMLLKKSNDEKDKNEYGNKILYGGPIMDVECRNNYMKFKSSTPEWGNDFHVYSARWTPEEVTLLVDGMEWGTINTTISGLQARLVKDKCKSLQETLDGRTAPFDDFFGISLGVSAGGILEFPNGVVSGTVPKPWNNEQNKARLKFYQAKSTWSSTWTQPALLVDYVRVRAL